MKTTKFKPSEVGPIPEEWEVKPFSECFTLMRNNTYSRDCLTDLPGSVANVHYGDVLIRYGAVLDFEKDSVPYLKSGVKPNKDLLKDGDLIFADTAEDETAGKAVEVQGVRPRMAVAGLHTVACRPQDEIFAPRYLGYYINSAAYHNQLLPLMTGTKVTSISRAGFVSTHVAIPPKSEQKKIAEALSDVDALLAAITKLIEKKRAIKQGAMQELLGMRNDEFGMRNEPIRRLAGFSGAWVEKRLGECGYCYNGITGKSANDFGHGEAKYITFLNVLFNVVIRQELFEDVDIAECERQNKVRKGDLFFNTSSETPEEVGYCAVLDDEVRSVYLNSFCFGFRITDETVDGRFMAYWFRSSGGRELMTFLAQGSTRYNLSKESFRLASVIIPPTFAEQKAIAAVLSDMDAEVAALESKRAKYESIKQGMMQELLTGKVSLG